MTDFNVTLKQTGKYELSYSYNIAGPYSAEDKVCLFVYNREKSYSDSKPITSASGEGKFTVSNVGYYNARIIRGSDTVHALARSEPVLIGPSVDLDAEIDGENIVVTYTINEDPAYPDLNGEWWIGAYKRGSLSNRLYLSYKYCTEKVSGGKVLFDISKDLKPTNDSRSFDFRFFFEKASPYKYSGSTSFEVMSRDSLSAIVTRGADNSCVTLTVYWERHDEPVWSCDWIGVYHPEYVGGAKVDEKYLTAGAKKDGSGNICFDLTEWYAKYKETQADVPVFEICYFTHNTFGQNYKVEEMTIKVDINGVRH